MHVERDLVARLERIGLPAAPDLLRRRAHLEAPLLFLAARLVDEHDAQPTMGVGPFHLFDRAADCDRLILVEHGKGMMGKSGRHEGGRGCASKTEGAQFHLVSPRYRQTLWGRTDGTEKFKAIRFRPGRWRG